MVEARSGRSIPPRRSSRLVAGSEAQQPAGAARRGPQPPGTLVWLERRRLAPRGRALRRFYRRVRGVTSGSGPGLIRRLSGPAQSRTDDWGSPVTAAISSVVCPARAASRTASTSPVRACSSSAARWRQRSSSGLSGLWFSPMWGSMARSPPSPGAARPSDDQVLTDDRARPGTPTARRETGNHSVRGALGSAPTRLARCASRGLQGPAPQTSIRPLHTLLALWPLTNCLSRRVGARRVLSATADFPSCE